MTEKTLPNRFAGTWYPGDAKELSGMMSSFFPPDEEKNTRRPSALLMPHAGYVYSGRCAAAAAGRARGFEFDRVIIIGPSHKAYFRDAACVPEANIFSSPLGEVEIDTELALRLASSGIAAQNDGVQENEHSAQLEIPFMQYALGNTFKVLPVIICSMSTFFMRRLAKALASELSDGRTLLVTSSDFVHYGETFSYVPFRENIKENLLKLDMGAFEKIKNIDPDGFGEYVMTTGATICGELPIRCMLSMLASDTVCELCMHSDSIDETGDESQCVSYLSSIFYGGWKNE